MSRRRSSAGWLASVVLMLSGCAMSTESRLRELETIPAEWVANEDASRPNQGDFTFDAVSFPSPTQGWIAGNRYLLHVADDELTVTFVQPTGVWLNSIDFPTPAAGWAGGMRVARSAAGGDERNSDMAGVVWRYEDRGWQSCDLSGLSWDDWSVSRVRGTGAGPAFADAVVTLDPGVDEPDDGLRVRRELLEWDGARWRVDPRVRASGRNWEFADACFLPNGDGWFVGFEPDGNARRAISVRQTGGVWQPVALPELTPAIASLVEVACLPDGGALAAGISGEPQHAPILIMFEDGSWRSLELPDRYAEASIGAIAAAAERDYWIALSATERAPRAPAGFLRWHDGAWQEVELPRLPEGRGGGLAFTDLQFVTPSEAWATARDYAGPGIVRGLIFHYSDGVWRNRNWTWSAWDQSWFGLFGD